MDITSTLTQHHVSRRSIHMPSNLSFLTLHATKDTLNYSLAQVSNRVHHPYKYHTEVRVTMDQNLKPCIRIWQISPFGLLLQTYSPNGAVLKEFPPWCCFVRDLHGFCMQNATFIGDIVGTGHVDGKPLLLLAISG